jgi:hypothetical protein
MLAFVQTGCDDSDDLISPPNGGNPSNPGGGPSNPGGGPPNPGGDPSNPPGGDIFSRNFWLLTETTNYNVLNGVVGSFSSEDRRKWISYTSETNYRFESTSTSTTNIVQTNNSWSHTQIGSTQSTGQSTRNGQALNSTSNSISDTTTTIVFVSDAIPDNITRTITETVRNTTSYYDLPSGLISRSTSNTTQTTTINNGAPTVNVQNADVFYTIELLNESGGVRTYKRYITDSTDGSYFISRITGDGITLEFNAYANNTLSYTITYTVPDNAVIRSRLPSFRLSSLVFPALPSNNSYQTCEVISESATTLVLRIKTFTNNVLTSQSDRRYERLAF